MSNIIADYLDPIFAAIKAYAHSENCQSFAARESTSSENQSSYSSAVTRLNVLKAITQVMGGSSCSSIVAKSQEYVRHVVSLGSMVEDLSQGGPATDQIRWMNGRAFQKAIEDAAMDIGVDKEGARHINVNY